MAAENSLNHCWVDSPNQNPWNEWWAFSSNAMISLRLNFEKGDWFEHISSSSLVPDPAVGPWADHSRRRRQEVKVKFRTQSN